MTALLQVVADATGHAVAATAQAASQVHTNTELGVFAGQVPAAFWVVWIIEKLKAWGRVPWINEYSGTLNRYMGIGAAFLASAGINSSVQGSIFDGGVLTVTFPSVWAITHFLAYDVARSYGVQQMFYRILSGPQNATTVLVRGSDTEKPAVAVLTGTGDGKK